MHKNKLPKARNPVVRGMLEKPSRTKLKHITQKLTVVRTNRKGAKDVQKYEV